MKWLHIDLLVGVITVLGFSLFGVNIPTICLGMGALAYLIGRIGIRQDKSLTVLDLYTDKPEYELGHSSSALRAGDGAPSDIGAIGHHVRDVRYSSKKRRRTIGNYINYKDGTTGKWCAAQSGISNAPGAPPNWAGAFDFRDHNITSALQFFSHDTTDNDNTALVGIRVDGTPDVWINYKAMNPDNLGVESVTNGNEISWPNLWTNSTLKWTHGIHYAMKEIILSEAGHPTSFSFSVKHSNSVTFQLLDNMIILLDQQENVLLNTRPVYAIDANGNGVGLTLTQTGTWGPGNQHPIITLTLDENDLLSATYPITVDPTTTIDYSGVEDNYLNRGDGIKNYGGSIYNFRVSYSSPNINNVSIVRFDESLIPAGTITELRFIPTVQSNFTTFDAEVYRVSDANFDWVEGTSPFNGDAEVGASCWDEKAYGSGGGTSWAGSAGLQTSGTDYDADASPPLIDMDTAGPVTVTLDAAWATRWRDVSNSNGGILLMPQTTGGNGGGYFRSTEYATAEDRPYFEIDYEPAPEPVATGKPFNKKLHMLKKYC